MKSIVRQEAPKAGGWDGHLPTWILQEQKKKYHIIRHGRKSIIFAHPEFSCFRRLCLHEIETFNIHYQFMDILNWKVVVAL